MAGNLADYAENKLLDHITGKASYTAPTNTYLALYTVAPTDSTSGTEVTASNGYARQQISWGAATSGQISTNATIRFPDVGTATGAWGTVVAIGILDAVSGGNLLWYGALSATVTIGNGDTYSITSGGLTLTID